MRLDSSDYGALQEMIDDLYAPGDVHDRLRIILAGESADLPHELLSLLNRLPSGSYTRTQLLIQLNSALSGNDFSARFGILD